MHFSRRELLRASALPVAGVRLSGLADGSLHVDPVDVDSEKAKFFKIGLSQVSLSNTIRAGEIDLLDYPSFVMDTFGIDEIEMVDWSMPGVDVRLPLLERMRARAEQAGTSVFMMRVDPFRLRSDDVQDRTAEVLRFYQQVDQAAVVGAKFVRVQLDTGNGSSDTQAAWVIDGLKRVADYAGSQDVSIAVEPGIGWSRNGLWLAGLIKRVNHPHCGSLPDLGKFAKFDRYVGVAALMASASVISAKTVAFNEQGLELHSDYPKLFQMMVDAGFPGIVTIEYEGEQAEVEGVRATQKLLQRLQESCTHL